MIASHHQFILSTKIFLFLGMILFGHLQKGNSQLHEVGLFFGRKGLDLSEQKLIQKNNSYDTKQVVTESNVIGIQYRYNLNNHYSLLVSANFFKFSSPPQYINSKQISDPDSSFEFNGRMEYWLLPRSLIDWDIPQLRPYIFAGGGVLINSPSTYLIKDSVKTWNYKSPTIMFTGIGLSINATSWLNFGLEFGARFIPWENRDIYEIHIERNTKGNNWYYIFGASTTISLKVFPLVN